MLFKLTSHNYKATITAPDTESQNTRTIFFFYRDRGEGRGEGFSEHQNGLRS